MARTTSPSKAHPDPGSQKPAGMDFVAPSWASIVEAHARIAPKIHRTSGADQLFAR